MTTVNRRDFLIQSVAAAAAAGGLYPRKVAGAAAKGRLSVAIVGCGRLGQQYAEIYRALPQTDLVAIAEWNPERLKVVGERFGVKALYRDAEAMLKEVVPDLAAIITPTKYMTGAVVACAEAGVKGVQTDRPFAAKLADADRMVETCKRRGTVLAGGALERSNWEVEEAGRRLASGELGKRLGAAVHSYRGEILAGGTARILVLEHFAQARVAELIAWGNPPEALDDAATDYGLNINGRFRLTSGLECQVFGSEAVAPHRGVEVWTEDALVRWDRHGEPLTQIFQGFDAKGAQQGSGPCLSALVLGLGVQGVGAFTGSHRSPWVGAALRAGPHQLPDRRRGQGDSTPYHRRDPAPRPGSGHSQQDVGPDGERAHQAAAGGSLPGPLPAPLPLAGRRCLRPSPVGHRGRRQEIITSRPGRFQAQWLFEHVLVEESQSIHGLVMDGSSHFAVSGQVG